MNTKVTKTAAKTTTKTAKAAATAKAPATAKPATAKPAAKTSRALTDAAEKLELERARSEKLFKEKTETSAKLADALEENKSLRDQLAMTQRNLEDSQNSYEAANNRAAQARQELAEAQGDVIQKRRAIEDLKDQKDRIVKAQTDTLAARDKALRDLEEQLDAIPGWIKSLVKFFS